MSPRHFHSNVLAVGLRKAAWKTGVLLRNGNDKKILQWSNGNGQVVYCRMSRVGLFYAGRKEHRKLEVEMCQLMSESEKRTEMIFTYFQNDERKTLMGRAVKRHYELMKEAREGRGCDRHLFGLYCLAMESGIEVPQLFSDPSYFKR